MNFIEFDPKKKYSFTVNGEPTRILPGDIILLQELKPVSRFKFLKFRPKVIIFVRDHDGFTLRFNDAPGIKFDASRDRFEWLAAFIAAVSNLDLEPHAVDAPHTVAFRFIEKREKIPEGTPLQPGPRPV